MTYRLPLVVIVAALVLIGDELLKSYVRARLAECDLSSNAPCAQLAVLGPLRLVRSENAGSALGYAQGWQLWLILAVVGLLVIPLYGFRLYGRGKLARFALGLQTGGAAGNLLDRLALGGATDMLTVGSGLVWNLADIALLAGTVIATWLLLRPEPTATIANRVT